jgi:Phytochelatin synthase
MLPAANRVFRSFEEFEEAVINATHQSNQFMAVSYSRACLDQMGSGHFSPIGAYCAEDGGMVLILDVARYKYAPEKDVLLTRRSKQLTMLTQISTFLGANSTIV